MADILKRAGNDALNTNKNVEASIADISLTTHGSDWYWAVTALMALFTLIFAGWAFTIPRSKRIFHYITASITLVASIAYFSMASNLGYAVIDVEFVRSNPVVSGINREIFYVRYIDWFVTTPLLLTDLMLTAGLPWPTVLFTVLIDEVMIVTGLVGALVSSRYKWGYWTFGMFALFFVAYNLVIVGLSHSKRLSPRAHKTYLYCGALTIFLWFLYPIAWGLAEGGNVISPDSEAVFYGILDLLAKPVFGTMLLFGHRGIDPAELGLHFRNYDEAEAHNEKSSFLGRRNGANEAAAPTTLTGAPATAPTSTGTHSTAVDGGHNTSAV